MRHRAAWQPTRGANGSWFAQFLRHVAFCAHYRQRKNSPRRATWPKKDWFTPGPLPCDAAAPAMSHSPVSTRDSRALFEIQLEPGSRGSRVGNLRDQLKAAIEDGRLAPGMRLPSLRDAPKLFRVARNTMAEVYEQLLNEGYVVARQGSGTFVADTLPRRSAAGDLRQLTGAPSQSILAAAGNDRGHWILARHIPIQPDDCNNVHRLAPGAGGCADVPV